jgi:glycosyltransferase involved in cell wall biosynthesis
MKRTKRPKDFVSIVTPNFNGEKYIEQTILSVVSQSYKNFEFIVIDGNSKDNSLKIIKKYTRYINKLISKKDNGMYDAIDKGINLSKGNIIIWINSDDILHKDAVKNIYNFFKKNPEISWITGRNGYIKKNIKISGIPYIYPRIILKNGLASHPYWGFVQQESTSFRKELYLKSGGFNKKYKNAADYGLWKKFANFTTLFTVAFSIGYFRTWELQDSQVHKKLYYKSIGFKKIPIFSLRFLRLFISLFFYPFIYLRTIYLLR